MNQGLLFLVLFFSILPGDLLQSNAVWGTRPLLSYFALTASLETPMRVGAGLASPDFSIVKDVAIEEAESLRRLRVASNLFIDDPKLSRKQITERFEAMRYNLQVDRIVYQTDIELRQRLSPSVYWRLVNWIEKQWLVEKKIHGAASIEYLTGEQAAARSYEVFATRYESKAGSYTVALPDQCLKFSNGGLKTCTDKGYQPGAGYSVAISYQKGVGVLVGEAGPWNIDDNYWSSSGDPQPRRMFADLPLGLPEAQAAYFNGYNGGKDQYGRKVTAPFGIDLAIQVADDIGLPPKKNDWITVSYLWTANWGVKPAQSGSSGSGTFDGTSAPTTNVISPISTAAPAADGSIVHTVKAGETLWTIAVVYGIPVAQIQFINNMGATIVIYEGQKLKIKEAGPTWTPIPDSDLIELQATTTISGTGTLTTSPTSERTLIAQTSPEVTIRADDPASGISLTGSLAEQANTPTPQPEVEKSSIELTDQNLLVGALVFAGSGVLLFGLGWYFSARARKETKS